MSLDDATPQQWDAAWKAAQSGAPVRVSEAPLSFSGAPVASVTLANPKQAFGDLKVPLQLVPNIATAYMAMGLKEGARKYGPFNWRETNVEAMTYVGAALRHIAAFVDGEDTDPDSGNPHLAHAMASLAILVDALESDKLIDNRPPEGPVAAFMKTQSEAPKC